MTLILWATILLESYLKLVANETFAGHSYIIVVCFRLTANGYHEINITSRHALGITTLPDLHKDPFDRLLLAQAISEGMHFLTCDALMADYGEPVICVKK